MYFKVDPDSDLHKTLSQVFEEMKAANKAALELAEELGFSQFRRSNHFALAGGIMSLYSEKGNKPENYAYTYGSKEPNDVFPKKNKANKEILDKIAALPIVSSDRLNDPINYDWRQHKYPTGNRHGQSHILFTPSAAWKNGEILISFPDYVTKYKPVKGMIEITFTEFQKLNK